MAFPVSNLPSASLPWGREVEKQINTLTTSIISNEINNTARDNQLASNYRRLDAAVIDAADAIAKVIDLSDPNGTTTVNANNIVGGTLKTATNGRHTEIASTQINFFDGSGNYSGRISAADDGRASTVEIETTSATGMIAYNGGVDLNGPGSTISAGNNGNGNILLSSSGGVDVSGSLDVSGYVAAGGSISTSSSISASGGIYGYSGAAITGQVSGGSLYTTGSLTAGATGVGSLTASGVVNATDTYSRNVQSGRIMYVASNGTYNCATSSARYKQDINPYIVDLEKFFQLEPVSFRYKMAVEQFGEEADVAHGFIAEQAAEVGMDEFVDFQEDENGNPRPDNFRYIDFTAAMYGVIKSQQQTIESLAARIEALESK
jgi:hypothetical protein